jgi:cytochrome c556
MAASPTGNPRAQRQTYDAITRSLPATYNKQETTMTRLLLAAVLGAAISLPAAAQFQKPEDAVKYRKAAFTLMNAHLGRIGAMVKGTTPYDPANATMNAELLATLSKLPFQGFVEGTAGNGEKGSPKANIWTERAKFDEAAKNMQIEVGKLVTAARSNDLEAVKAAFGPAAKSCASCHDAFRAK